MARTAITLNTLTPNGSIAAPAGNAVDQANGMNLAIPANAIPTSPDMDTLVLVVTNSAGSTKAITIDAGVGGGATPGPAFRSGLGALTVNVATTATVYIGPLESARFAQLDGSLNVDFASGFTGTITALILPTRW
jgi:hypothetical protein